MKLRVISPDCSAHAEPDTRSAVVDTLETGDVVEVNQVFEGWVSDGLRYD